MNLTEWRKSQKLTITKAAERFGISQPSLSRIESGEQWPDAEVIDRIVAESGGAIDVSELHAAFMEARRGKQEGAPA